MKQTMRSICLLFWLVPGHWTPAAFGQAFAPEFEAWNVRISSAPQQVLDELLNHPVATTDTAYQAQYQFLLSSVYLNLVYPGKALEAAQLGLSKLTAQQPGWLFHRLLLVKSQAMELSGQAAMARPLAQQALVWAEQEQDTSLTIDALIGLGYIDNTLGQYTAALDHFMRAYQLAPVSDAVITRDAIAGSIALVYEYRKEFALAVPYFEEAVNHHRQTKNLLELSIALYGLGRANKHLGHTDTGIAQLQESLDISRAIDDQQGVAYALKELAPHALLNEQPEQAREMLNEAAEIFARGENPYMLFDVHKSLAQLNLRLGDVNQARNEVINARVHLKEETMPIQAVSLAELESEILASEGLYRQAFEQLIKTVGHKQQLLAEQSARELHELRAQHELDSKARENDQLSAQNASQRLELLAEKQHNQLLTLSVAAAAVILGLLVILVYRNKQQQKALSRLANTDQLTCLPNRSHILELLSKKQQQLTGDQTLMVCMLDLDHFKKINDELGHDVGDQTLSLIGSQCQELITPPDLAGRFGGEEFLIILEGTEQLAYDRLLQLQAACTQAGASLLPNHLPMSFSAGISRCGANDELKAAIIAADLAMYQAKNAGRGQVHIHPATATQ